MPPQDVLSTVLLNIFPFLCVAAIWCLKFFEHQLPGKQQEMLEKCVTMAVTMAEQAYDTYGPFEKKQIALHAAIDLFQAFHLPVPQPAALNTAIESAVFNVHQTQQKRPASAYLDASTRMLAVPPLKPAAPVVPPSKPETPVAGRVTVATTAPSATSVAVRPTNPLS
ncbi:phage holin, LLH family [Dictyobacter arantiisoli]|uniref:Uncharacterized protein n=1 Tax=Dictyobacter arantiisoli TaxID=2014874 RepID=A0A5A5TJ11_9CHLR|nr:phage holin, LLH family [Dictyobacter arantiisoli]GCF11215.1 hypothetical protein KDI_47790 [Dictyobacter arantiisoli]